MSTTPTTSRPVECPNCGNIVFVHDADDNDVSRSIAAMKCPQCARRRKHKPEREIQTPYRDD